MTLHKDMSGGDLHKPKNHGSNHTDGTDDVRDASATQKGLMTLAYASKLDNVSAGADVTEDALAAATERTSISDQNLLPFLDEYADSSGDSSGGDMLMVISFSNFKGILKEYFDTLYAPL